MDDVERYNRVYLEILLRYKEIIEEHEVLYFSELPKLVKADEEVKIAAEKILGSFDGYNFEKDFDKAAEKAYEYVNNEIRTIILPLQVWLSPGEVIRCGAGDQFDKAVLLCSLFLALGCVNCKVLVVSFDSSRKIGVYYESKSYNYFGIDECKKTFSSREEMLSYLKVGSDEVVDAYEFNSLIAKSLP
ncbi:MAG: hypothetical protein QXL16_02530 [Candidatus Micrarchaeaceae archaeon]